MIVEALVEIILVPLSLLLNALPDFTEETVAGFDALRAVAAVVELVRPWIHMTALFGVLGLWATIEVGLVATRIATWVYARIPFKAT